ncbi:MAG: histidinol-phosphate aminotransferase family protein [Gemmatimonadales bacterium]|nr:MAG: histidinol-phosphate aminotransferase family protein [Gemmatimonadales bacterium]
MTDRWLPPDPAFPGELPPMDPHGGTRPGDLLPVGGGDGSGPRVHQEHSRHRPRLVDLSSNVLPFPPDPQVLSAVRAAPLEHYPDPDAVEARRALAHHWDIHEGRILLAPGASELIHRIALAYLAPGDSVLIVGSTFGEYRRASLLRGAGVMEVGRGHPHLPSVEEVVDYLRKGQSTDTSIRLVFLCTPNNPTGDAWSETEVETLAASLPSRALLVLDESYRSISSGGLVPPHAPENPRILHLRSLTKDLCLPGLRVAVAIGPPPVLQLLHRIAPPWLVSTPAQAAVVAAVRPAVRRRLGDRVRRTWEAREQMARALRTRGFRVESSVVSYLLWTPWPQGNSGNGRSSRRRTASETGNTTPPDHPSAAHESITRPHLATQWVQELESRDVRVRDASSFGLPGWLRVGVGTPPENERFLEVLDRIASEGGW